MISKVKTCCINGLVATEIEVEIDITNGLPMMNIVGLPDTAVKESRERVRAAIKNSGFDFPLKRITVNLAPGDTKKEGTHFDLPIALGIMLASNQIETKDFSQTIVLGELSLDGRINRVSGVLPMLLEMYRKGYRKVILPLGNIQEAKLVTGLKCIGLNSLEELMAYLENEGGFGEVIGEVEIENGELFWEEDFEDLLGQESLRRALEIAAAGGHNLLMVGPPGSGKTMAARRLPSILPSLTFDEALEITQIYSVSGLLNRERGLIRQRPFRCPHHTITTIALTGGGRVPKPGEVSLSHKGVLFLDELPEFDKNAIEVLRQPLEDGIVSISRNGGAYIFPAQFMLIAAMNPCPCGYYGFTGQRECSCSPQEIKRYIGKVSGPLLDRIDMMVETGPITYGELVKREKAESSKEIRSRVERARNIQLKRYKKIKLSCNAQLTSRYIRKFCSLNEEGQVLMQNAFEKMNLSARAYNRIIKVARSIADLEESEHITSPHLAEALQYRNINSLIWR